MEQDRSKIGTDVFLVGLVLSVSTLLIFTSIGHAQEILKSCPDQRADCANRCDEDYINYVASCNPCQDFTTYTNSCRSTCDDELANCEQGTKPDDITQTPPNADPITALQQQAALDGVIGYNGSKVEIWSFEEVQKIENNAISKRGIVRSGDFENWLVRKGFDGNSWVGGLFRLIGGAANQYTIDQPTTKKFLSEVQIISGSEMDTIKHVYEKVTDTVTIYRGVEDLSKTFETMITTGVGVCRDRANLLDYSLKLKGINSQLVVGGSHQWIRVTTQIDGKSVTFDLDPTWYKEFFPLNPRDKKISEELDDEYPSGERPLEGLGDGNVEYK